MKQPLRKKRICTKGIGNFARCSVHGISQCHYSFAHCHSTPSGFSAQSRSISSARRRFSATMSSTVSCLSLMLLLSTFSFQPLEGRSSLRAATAMERFPCRSGGGRSQLRSPCAATLFHSLPGIPRARLPWIRCPFASGLRRKIVSCPPSAARRSSPSLLPESRGCAVRAACSPSSDALCAAMTSSPRERGARSANGPST